ncbi:pyrimidine-nucleoside phosphorylase [Caldalkalibacillus thermarum TA2.A1]|uniref:Pyrimidine-nucleoside phosphorylase n=1 Tax=Caldalkalibacillus thermarum (strain TA2.A1) TaxID=986075 RepID=F5L877_CALTT|nr:pyrimidine-nucleoside phosphorylase [Caldalkalibacillus thermarum]EGL82490.1 pyrimidine-nucleoside phosphorylase [Caldalkalibacillus thermarum TA2.A1]QZT33163.1 pyrimidine-nucleoside phosphorylase [Caldalkalibacillus thermarum TA2.A1]
MRMVDLIQKKRDGFALSKEEIHFIIEGYTQGTIPDYQMAALAMAIYFRGMDSQETSHLTMAMVQSGETIDLSPIKGIKVDKHSTGGVGDKTSLIVAPLVATVGVPVAKMSGRGLGHTGGTIDKLESIEGFQTELTPEQFFRNVNEIKLALVGQSGNLAPADKKLYALRDVTATVNSIPLIASSIMSKKLASGADAIVLDVKTGSGAFMKKLEDAKALAEAMVSIGKELNRQTIAVISDMNQPLGYEVGNANEVREAIEVLKGEGEAGLTKLCLTIAAYMTVAGQIYPDFDSAYEELDKVLRSGQALETFKRFVQAQGGNPEQIDDPEKLPQASFHVELKAEEDGYVTQIDAEAVGIAAMLLGAGRATKEDTIDHAVGITLRKKVGDPVQKGEVLAVLHSNSEQPAASINRLKQAIVIGKEKVNKLPLIYDVLQ